MIAPRPLPVESRPRVLFNPDTRSANFFIPGLLVVLCRRMATMLTANAIVREKEQGTLEQLYMTPVRPGELIFSDFDGVVVIPRQVEDEVLRLAAEKAGKESETRRELLAGRSLRDVFNQYGVL